MTTFIVAFFVLSFSRWNGLVGRHLDLSVTPGCPMAILNANSLSLSKGISRGTVKFSLLVLSLSLSSRVFQEGQCEILPIGSLSLPWYFKMDNWSSTYWFSFSPWEHFKAWNVKFPPLVYSIARGISRGTPWNSYNLLTQSQEGQRSIPSLSKFQEGQHWFFLSLSLKVFQVGQIEIPPISFPPLFKSISSETVLNS